jgi:hypothetical protein
MIGNERSVTSIPITIAAIFMTFLIAYPARVPNRNPPTAQNRMFSIDKLLGTHLPNLDY